VKKQISTSSHKEEFLSKNTTVKKNYNNG